MMSYNDRVNDFVFVLCAKIPQNVDIIVMSSIFRQSLPNDVLLDKKVCAHVIMLYFRNGN